MRWQQSLLANTPRQYHLWLKILSAALGGALLPLAMAPYSLWPASIIGLVLVGLSLRNASPKLAMGLGFSCGVMLFGVGVSWVYVAIAQFGSSSAALAAVLTALFVVGLALVFAAPFYFYGRFLSHHYMGQTLGFAALWVFGEWLRSWLFTGFPWLYVGYAHIDTPLSGFAPLFGIFGVSLATTLTASALISLRTHMRRRSNPLAIAAIFGSVMLLWVGGWGLKSIAWTQPKPHTISVGLMQPNIPQEHKWDPAHHSKTLDTFSRLSTPLWDLDWVIWPEAAIPYPYHQATELLDQIDSFAKARGTVFITGIIYDDFSAYKYYNAIIARGAGGGEYFKQRLVPFGEYVPFEEQLRGLISFFDLPTSIIHLGPYSKSGLNANGVLIAAAICYEIVYPDLIAQLTQQKDVILTISNDAWFGLSNGPLQHFDMARMRAIETGRYVIRSTNNGVSGIINPKGGIELKGGRFTQESLQGEVVRMKGITPFMLWQSWPVVLLILLMLTCSAMSKKRYKPLHNVNKK